jgi:hypothetical protein
MVIKLLDDINTLNKYDNSISPELNLILSCAGDNMICCMMIDALFKGNPKGDPGHLDISSLELSELQLAIKKGRDAGEDLTEKSTQLLNACEYLLNIRESLLIADDESNELLSIESWGEILLLVNNIIAANKKDPKKFKFSWPICKVEVEFISEHANIMKLRNGIVTSVICFTQIYKNRQIRNINGNNIEVDVNEVTLSCEDLRELLKFSLTFKSTSDYYSLYLYAANSLISIRESIITNDWTSLKYSINDAETKKKLSIIPICLEEYKFAKSVSSFYKF